jgi:hypothetical protein
MGTGPAPDEEAVPMLASGDEGEAGRTENADS